MREPKKARATPVMLLLSLGCQSFGWPQDAGHPIQLQRPTGISPSPRHGMEQLKRDGGESEEEVSISRFRPRPHLALVPLIPPRLLFSSFNIYYDYQISSEFVHTTVYHKWELPGGFLFCQIHPQVPRPPFIQWMLEVGLKL